MDKQFYNDLAVYIKDLSSRLTGAQEGVQKTLTERELKNVKKILSKIVDLRVNKIIQTFMTGDMIATNKLAEAELELAENVTGLVNKVNELKSSSSLIVSNGKVEKTDSERIILKFLKPIPRVVCTDLKAYGPFSSEDISSLPAQDAKKLVERGVAVRVEPFSRGG